MSDTEFMRNMKKWFWSFLLGQTLIVVFAGAIFYGSITTTVGQHTRDIEKLQNTKADLNTVLRIKGETDNTNKIILDDLRSIKERQDDLYKLLLEHVDKK